MKKVSVIIPCYNVSDCLPRCMEHIIKQTIGVENIEIILIDDASTDEGATLELMLAYEKEYPDSVMVIPLERNMRQGGARNIGITYAGGEYLMFCDADDWLAYGAMEILYDTAGQYDADVVEYRYKVVTDDAITGEEIEQGNGSYLKLLADKEIKRKTLMASTDDFSLGCMRKFYRMSLIKENGIRFAEHLICEEPSFTLPVRLYEKRHVFVDAVLYYYLQTQNSTVHREWDTHKWDNAKVWLLLMEELRERGFYACYRKELECMFYDWGFGLSVSMLIQKGYMLAAEEMNFLKDMLLNLFPDILHNSYVMEKTEGLDMILKTILEVELTEGNVKGLNHALQKYLLAL
ncbi:MAG: glycosyltransferase [Roseburia sp.]|nr:glycosyltransferase [Roseburia sp.]MCM1242762.1 glycosyltransferase [Roseburia sp.]